MAHSFKNRLQQTPVWSLIILLYLLMLALWGGRLWDGAAGHKVESILSLGGSGYTLMRRPWSLLTYFWLHNNLLHLNINALILLLYGEQVLRHYSVRRFCFLFIGGGLSGGLCYLLLMPVIEWLGLPVLRMPLLGSSAAVMALLISAIILQPNYKLRFAGLQLPLHPIALLFLLLSTLYVGFDNIGGHLAHLGGILMGICATLYYRRADARQRQLQQIQQEQEARNRALVEQINNSGYGSLSEEQKKQLLSEKADDLSMSDTIPLSD